jgi:hypothetical protein
MQNSALQLALGLRFRSPRYVCMWPFDDMKWDIIWRQGVGRPRILSMWIAFAVSSASGRKPEAFGISQAP